MSKIEVNEIVKSSGSTLTIGGSGTAVTLGSGATQSGFGRTGTVDWQTSIKTTAFTAVSGEGYFCNTSSSAFTVTLPASPSVGDIVAVKDYAGTFDTNNLTLGRNSSNIEGEASNKVLSTESLSITFVYADATKGWLAVNDMAQSQVPKYVAATGGTVTTVCTDYKVHTFTGPGTFTVSCAGNSLGSNTVDYLVIAGGGGGGGDYGGGGGSGGYRFSDGTNSGSYTAGPSPLGASALSVSAQDFPITVGSGGSKGTACTKGSDGSNSVFSTITSAGGGAGGVESSAPEKAGNPGGSGGGASYGASGGNGNTPPVSPPQGNDGADGGPSGGGHSAAGGGGAGAVGGAPPSTPVAGAGGAGLTSCITASPVARGGGGGGAGGGSPHSQAYTPGAGGTGGGGAGAPDSNAAGVSGTANTGGGGGGGNNVNFNGGVGGSGVVIIRYKFQ